MKASTILSMAVLGFAPCCFAARAPAVPPPVPPVKANSPSGPAPTVVPQSYTWDGHEYAGVVDGRDYYLAPGHVWLQMGPTRQKRFDAWQKSHPNWMSQETKPQTKPAGMAPPNTPTIMPTVDPGVYGPH